MRKREIKVGKKVKIKIDALTNLSKNTEMSREDIKQFQRDYIGKTRKIWGILPFGCHNIILKINGQAHYFNHKELELFN